MKKSVFLRRLWRAGGIVFIAMYYLRKLRRTTQKAKSILLPTDEWNINWLGEEMRPFNSFNG